jgi:nitrate/TMAO reductase-like tetraheme cytochrome c subunit
MSITDKRTITTWSRRTSSGTFRHEGGDHPNIACTSCHTISTMNTSDRKSLVVQVQSCGGAEGCHITATAADGGILNYEIDQKKTNQSFACTKCHISFGKESVPANHLAAVTKTQK